ncbi:MAG: hypothetical protein ACW98K_07205 [Candidatus Kariarchaeaceae archaeon]|jgi:DNA-binding NarL/FixJ family response regulator
MAYYQDAEFESLDITNLLVVGDSDSSMSLVRNLINLANLTRVAHVNNCQDAATLLLLEEFSVVILDNDSPQVHAISFSRVVRINHPITRIIVISEDISTEFVYDLFNRGSIDSFLPIPIDDFTAYSVILEQQARHAVSDAVKKIVIKPPKFSPAYYLLYDQSGGAVAQTTDYEFLGVIISSFSVTRFAFFYDTFLSKNESLLSVYISAITLIGQQLFDKGLLLNEVNFGGISVYFYFEEDLQFSFLIGNLNESNSSEVENLISKIIQDLLHQAFPVISSRGIITDYHDELIAELIDSRVKMEVVSPIEYKRTEYINCIFYENNFPALENVLSQQIVDINIEIIESLEILTTYLQEHVIDILVINPIFKGDISKLPLASHFKDTSPKTQIIVVIDTYSLNTLLTIMQFGVIESVFSLQDDEERISPIVKRIAEKAQRIRENSKIPLPHNLRFSFEQSEFVRSLLQMHSRSYQRMEIPHFYGLFVSRDSIPYYQQVWSEGDVQINFDSELFAGFLSSLAFFSNEMFDTSESVTGVKFGETTLVVQNQFEFCFVYFIGKLESANLNLLQNSILQTTFSLYDIISESPIFDLSNESKLRIEQVLVDLFMRFSSLNI